MIGPAEIEDMLADYAEALAEAGLVPAEKIEIWPVTQRPEARPIVLASPTLQGTSETILTAPR
jgi:hypothetical protein